MMRFIVPVSKTTELFALAGSAGYKADLEPGVSNGLFGEDAIESGLGVDIGADRSFTFRLAGRDHDGSGDQSAALITAGFNYRF